MSKKDILRGDVEYAPIEVGSWIYVWTPGGQKPQPDRSRACMISAHGETSLITSGAGAPKHVYLAYYCPHGSNISGSSLMLSATRQLKVKELFGPGQAKQDYKLTKYQGSHSGANETYGKIQTGVHRRAREKDVEKNHAESKRLLQKRSVEDWERSRLEGMSMVKDVVYDIVTIRNRLFSFGTPTLFSVVADLEKAGFYYSTVHCFFCRGFGKDDDENYRAERRN
ncbi:hypothetical protein J8F10_36250 [Gemmata sp. G18]|uniref:Putative adhesin Stv domain-containing protein n=1 Tax=Gemmata palustris TaxID=2822762 RepID=A0ABS5C444_9BACT|nr:hypothetical protein [Gemmata palustris]MBP3960709.1 hypothetical protein [Gemmata palustris]